MSQATNLVERMYEAFAKAGLDTMLAAAAPDIVLEQDPALPWGGRYEGPTGIAEFFMKLVGTSETGITTEALFEAGDKVIQYGRSSGTVRANGATFDIPECHVWTLDGDRVTKIEFFIDSTSMIEALGR